MSRLSGCVQAGEAVRVEQDRPASSQLDEPARLGITQHTVDSRARRAGKRCDVLLDQGDHHRRRAAVDPAQLEHAPRDPRLRVDGVGLHEPLGEEGDVLGEDADEHLVDSGMLASEAAE